MKIPYSIYIDYFLELPVEEAIRELFAAGFTHGELSIEHLAALMERPTKPQETGGALRAFLQETGFAIPQGHLSFRKGLTEEAIELHLKPELEFFAAAGIRKAILHVNGLRELTDEARYETWLRNLAVLDEFVAGTGVTLCLENLNSVPQCRSIEQLLGILRDCGGKNLAICLDTGHLHLSNKQGFLQESHSEFITRAGEHLQALHITDNNGLGDTHQMPFSARYGVDWHDVMQALTKVGYSDLFNLEILGERNAPMPVKRAKLAYLKSLCEYMLSEEFLAEKV